MLYKIKSFLQDCNILPSPKMTAEDIDKVKTDSIRLYMSSAKKLVKRHKHLFDLLEKLMLDAEYVTIYKDRSDNIIIKTRDVILRFEFSQKRLCVFGNNPENRRDYVVYDIENIDVKNIVDTFESGSVTVGKNSLSYRIGFDTNGGSKQFMELCRQLDKLGILNKYQIRRKYILCTNVDLYVESNAAMFKGIQYRKRPNSNSKYYKYDYRTVLNLETTTYTRVIYIFKDDDIEHIADLIKRYNDYTTNIQR